MADEEFYLRYYVGHKGKFGHEFLEFEFKADGRLRYANNSNYKNDTMIRKQSALRLANCSKPALAKRAVRGTRGPYRFRQSHASRRAAGPRLAPALPLELPHASQRVTHTCHCPARLAFVCAAYVSQAVLAEVKRIVAESEIVREDDKQWPLADRNGGQVPLETPLALRAESPNPTSTAVPRRRHARPLTPFLFTWPRTRSLR